MKKDEKKKIDISKLDISKLNEIAEKYINDPVNMKKRDLLYSLKNDLRIWYSRNLTFQDMVDKIEEKTGVKMSNTYLRDCFRKWGICSNLNKSKKALLHLLKDDLEIWCSQGMSYPEIAKKVQEKTGVTVSSSYVENICKQMCFRNCVNIPANKKLDSIKSEVLLHVLPLNRGGNDFTFEQVSIILKKKYNILITDTALREYVKKTFKFQRAIHSGVKDYKERKIRFLEYLKTIDNIENQQNNNNINKEKTMENNEIKVTDKVLDYERNTKNTEAIADTNNIIDNFNKDSDDMFEKEMPVNNEENINRYSNSFAKAMCNAVTSIEVVINRLNNEGVSDRIYTLTTDEQKLSMLTVLNKIFDYSFGKERKKVFTVSYTQFVNDFKEYVDFNNMYDATRIFRDFDTTRDVINIIVIEDVEEDKSSNNDVFEMELPPLHAAFTHEATVDLDYVSSLRKKHNKFMLENKKEECKILDKENELWEKYIKLEEEYNADGSDMAYMNYLMDRKPLSVDMHNNLSKKYDNLQKAYLALKEYNNNLLEHIYAKEDQQD